MSLNPLGQPKQQQVVHNDFDVMQEISRGALYAGGERAANWWNGYTFALKIVIVVITCFFVLCVLHQELGWFAGLMMVLRNL